MCYKINQIIGQTDGQKATDKGTKLSFTDFDELWICCRT